MRRERRRSEKSAAFQVIGASYGWEEKKKGVENTNLSQKEGPAVRTLTQRAKKPSRRRNPGGRKKQRDLSHKIGEQG